MSNQKPLTIKSLGRVASLRDLYDARNEIFLNYSLLKENLPTNCIDIQDQKTLNFKYDFSNTHETKFSNLDVNAELKISVLCGQVILEGSGKYLTDKKENHKSVKADLIYEITTKNEKLLLSQESLKKCVSYDSIGLKDATHVVTSIKWGANVYASFEYSNDENSDKTQINGNLKAIVEKLRSAVEAKAEAGAQFTEGQNKLKTQLSIKFFGNVGIKGKVPQTYEEVSVVMGDLQNFIDETNAGKGIEMFFV